MHDVTVLDLVGPATTQAVMKLVRSKIIQSASAAFAEEHGVKWI